ncbi:hypothetical protein ACRAWD_25780 [Caulobacter segnis]
MALQQPYWGADRDVHLHALFRGRLCRRRDAGPGPCRAMQERSPAWPSPSCRRPGQGRCRRAAQSTRPGWSAWPFRSVIASAGLWLAVPGETGRIPLILACLVVAGRRGRAGRDGG